MKFRETQYSVSQKIVICYLDTVYPEHGHVVAAVQSEAHYVQSKEVEIQTNHTAIK